MILQSLLLNRGHSYESMKRPKLQPAMTKGKEEASSKGDDEQEKEQAPQNLLQSLLKIATKYRPPPAAKATDPKPKLLTASNKYPEELNSLQRLKTADSMASMLKSLTPRQF